MAHGLQKQLGGTGLHYVHLLVYYYWKSKTFSAVNFPHSQKGSVPLSAGLTVTNSPRIVLFVNVFKIYFFGGD